MRFEAKNSYFKRLAQSIGNFKNVCKTVAIRHQRLSCYNLADSSIFVNEITESGKGWSLSVWIMPNNIIRMLHFKGKKWLSIHFLLVAWDYYLQLNQTLMHLLHCKIRNLIMCNANIDSMVSYMYSLNRVKYRGTVYTKEKIIKDNDKWYTWAA